MGVLIQHLFAGYLVICTFTHTRERFREGKCLEGFKLMEELRDVMTAQLRSYITLERLSGLVMP